MNYTTYREKLGIGSSDQQKADMLRNKITIFFHDVGKLLTTYAKEHQPEKVDLSFKNYFLKVGELPYQGKYGLSSVRLSITQDASIPHIISKYCVFLNVAGSYIKDPEAIVLMQNRLLTFLDELGIQYSITGTKHSILVFPSGAEEFDAALVSEPLMWLSEYPKTQKMYLIALRQYEEGIYIRDVADNLRKALEQFFQEFLGNNKNLERNKNEICRFLSSAGVDSDIAGLYQPLINTYKNINDRCAKHNDLVDKRLLEFLLYQTGILIRMVLVVKQSEPSSTVPAVETIEA